MKVKLVVMVLVMVPVMVMVMVGGCGRTAGRSAAGTEAGRSAGAVVAPPAPQAPQTQGPLQIAYPFDGAVFPPEIIAPTFRWTDSTGARRWKLKFAPARGPAVEQASGQASFRPEAGLWEELKKGSLGAPTVVTIEGFGAGEAALSSGVLRFSTSADPVGDSLFYREVVLPFRQAVKDPSQLVWRYGSIASEGQPPVVLSNLPVCGNCHSFSADGAVLGMDVDYANDKGSFAMVGTGAQMELSPDKVLNWKGAVPGDAGRTFGLLPQVSPDGRFAAATVKDRSVFVALDDDLAYSQLFFPLKGVLGWYDSQEKVFGTLPGADDPQFVQTNPVWTPDGQSLLFARAPKYDLRKVRNPDSVMLTREECPEFFGPERRKMRYDLYRIPFNGGRGGQALPLGGAAGNGKSNFFPRPSPDGRWVVFCQADSYMLLQPDSQLYIMPLEGGSPRRLVANRAGMNSWHSWSSNSRWLVFASKVNGPYTQLFLTHIDEEGQDSVPVLLEQFTAPQRAANIPEFVPRPADYIKQIRPLFLDADSYQGAGEALVAIGGQGSKEDLEKALAMYRKALELDPKDATAQLQAGLTLAELGRPAEAVGYWREAVRLDPGQKDALYNLALFEDRSGRLVEAAAGYQKVVDLDPEFVQARLGLVVLHLRQGLAGQAKGELQEILKLKPDWEHALFYLGRIAMDEGNLEEARGYLERVVKGAPGNPEPYWRLAVVCLAQERNDEALGHLKAGLAAFPDNPNLMDVQAVALARKGRFAEAKEWARKALERVDPATGGGAVKVITRHLEEINAGRVPQL